MHMLDRRMLLRAGSAAVGAAALAPTAPALARAPQAGKRAQPSFYRFKLGAIEITVVSDGTLAFPAETLWGDRAEGGGKGIANFILHRVASVAHNLQQGAMIAFAEDRQVWPVLFVILRAFLIAGA